jgi:putative mRNA 3-end processing factor
MDLIVVRPEGLYCPPGDFHIDPWRPVEHAIVTHAHADHARPGSRHYVASRPSLPVLRARLGEVTVQTLDYRERITRNGVTISLHPAGHVLGSAQVRVEHRGETWVVSGDYKLASDPTCAAFEPVRAHTFVTESTFGLPIYRWRDPADIIADIAAWWRDNAHSGRTSVLYGYAFGKSQRIAAALQAADTLDIVPLACHGAVAAVYDAYEAAGVALPPMLHAPNVDRAMLPRALVLAPPSAAGTPWLRRFGDFSDAFASGWMQVRGARRRRALDRGFALSDHADWPGLNVAIEASGATRVIVTHGQVPEMVRWLSERGWDAQAFQTEFADEGEPDAVQDVPAPVPASGTS